MLLREYAAKRKAAATPEPPARAMPPGGRIFCVQRHDARGLHYDLRLEQNGVLCSWAVPQGPTLDPQSKRLAVQVEDHPVDYANFEGNIPAGNYGAGSVMLWDLGQWAPLTEVPVEEQFARGDLKFYLDGRKLRGEFALVRMKARARARQPEWLLLKKPDRFAAAGWDADALAWSILTGRTQAQIATGAPALTMPERAPRLMLAQIAPAPPAGEDWLYEVKWDGVRATATVQLGRLTLRSRRGDDITDQYPELAALPSYVCSPYAVLDGEIAVCDPAGRPRFNLIQPRIMARGKPAIAALARTAPASFFAFDLLQDGAEDLRVHPLSLRRHRLEQILLPHAGLRLSEAFSGGAALLSAARQLGLEGIMAKRLSSAYHPRRHRDWLKIKIANEDDFVICGYTVERRSTFGALVLAAEEGPGELRYVGNVGTGFDEAAQAELLALMQPLRRQEPTVALKSAKRIVWLRPELKCRVRFLEVTPQGNLRAPVFAGLSQPPEPRAAPAQPTVRPAAARVTHPNKVLFPKDGIIKRALVDYYDSVAHLLLPHLKDRPLTLLRYPDGIEKPGFYQKETLNKLPSWFPTVRVETPDGTRHLAMCNTREDLLYLINLNCIDLSAWMSRAPRLEQPDFLLIDLDPHQAPYSLIVDAALAIRDRLQSLGLRGYPKTTGGDGMHIYVPLEPVYRFDQVRSFAEVLARLMAQQHPKLFTLERALKSRAPSRIYFDWLQIGEGKTISAPYVVRPKPGAPVATPLDWSEVRRSLLPGAFNIGSAPARFERKPDLFAPALKDSQRLEAAVERLDEMLRTLADVKGRPRGRSLPRAPGPG